MYSCSMCFYPWHLTAKEVNRWRSLFVDSCIILVIMILGLRYFLVGCVDFLVEWYFDLIWRQYRFQVTPLSRILKLQGWLRVMWSSRKLYAKINRNDWHHAKRRKNQTTHPAIDKWEAKQLMYRSWWHNSVCETNTQHESHTLSCRTQLSQS